MLVTGLILFSGLWAAFFWTRPPLPVSDPVKLQVLSRNETVQVGGVRRPITDVRTPPAPRDTGSPLLNYGAFPPIPLNANEQVKSVVEARKNKTNPERLSILIPPTPFNQEEYDKDSDAYVRRIEPGRIWQTAKPGPGVPRLKSLTPQSAKIEQGEPFSLRVKAIKGAPVTFSALDGGEFQNRLRTITVKADDEGIARATFVGIPGTIDEVKLLAASPMLSGQLQYFLYVQLPRKSVATAEEAKP